MEFPELLASIFRADCSTRIEESQDRLAKLAAANGSNDALRITLNYFRQTKKSPNAEDLRRYAPTQPATTIDTIADDLDQAIAATPIAGNFDLELVRAEEAALTQYVRHGYRTANLISLGQTNFNKRRLLELYGDDEARWDLTSFSQIWLTEYLAANPFIKREEEEEVDPANEHEFELATGVGVDGEEVVNLKLLAINAADIVPEALRWLWQDRIVYGKICLFSGKPGCGKTLAVLDLIARVTTGADWPDGTKNTWGPKRVLLACSEDGLEDTVVPRLNAAGADLKHVMFIHRVLVNGETQRQLQLDSDTSLLKKALKDNPDIALVVLDPLTSFFGDININVDKEVRPVMDALSKICNATGVSFISIIHHNKRSDVDALQKILGASSLVGAVRTIWGFSRDPEDKTQHYMSLVKSNLSAKDTGLKYTIDEKETLGIKAACIVWGEESEATANELLEAERDTNKSGATHKQITLAKEFLPVALSKGQRYARDLYRDAQERGISEKVLKQASYDLGIIKKQLADGWVWRMNGVTLTEDIVVPDPSVL